MGIGDGVLLPVSRGVWGVIFTLFLLLVIWDGDF